MKDALRQALRILCLPLLPDEETDAANSFARFLESKNISDVEYFSWIKLQLGLWEDSGEPHKLIAEAIDSVLNGTKQETYEVNAKSYLKIHKKLKTEYRYSHSEAVAFLSHLRLAKELAVNHRLSSARLTHILGQLDGRIHFSSQNVSMALKQIGYAATVSSEQMKALFSRDQREETNIFADADLATGAELIALNASELGFKGDLKKDLLTLAPEQDVSNHIAHIQLLHYQCSLLDFYDHSTVNLYEFSPRGIKANWLFAQYPSNLASSGNPFLNIAKSVSILDRSWVESKGTLRPAALSLFNILSSLDELSYAERREVAMQIRAWIFLFLRLSGNTPTPLPKTLDSQKLIGLLRTLSGGNTETLGILEQRIVDAISASKYQKTPWRPRGLSDSINATNVSRKKLGDCDYQNSGTLRIEAFESHGGKLTRTYIDEHIRTLRKVLPLRVEELSSVANLEDWRATITFVAQSFDCAPPANMKINGLQIQFKIQTFADFTRNAWTEIPESIIGRLFLDPLRERRTPEEVRLKLLAILAQH